MFSVVCYNLLAEVHTAPRFIRFLYANNLLNEKRYPYVHPSALARKYRVTRINEELEALSGDIICLQEVQNFVVI